MKKYLAIFIVIITFTFAILCISVEAHRGRTDANGGHYNHSTGEYHYHHGYPEHQHYDMDGDGDIDCKYDFDNNSNHSSSSSNSSNSSSANSSSSTGLTITNKSVPAKTARNSSDTDEYVIYLIYIGIGAVVSTLYAVVYFNHRRWDTVNSNISIKSIVATESDEYYPYEDIIQIYQLYLKEQSDLSVCNNTKPHEYKVWLLMWFIVAAIILYIIWEICADILVEYILPHNLGANEKFVRILSSIVCAIIFVLTYVRSALNKKHELNAQNNIKKLQLFAKAQSKLSFLTHSTILECADVPAGVKYENGLPKKGRLYTVYITSHGKRYHKNAHCGQHQMIQQHIFNCTHLQPCRVCAKGHTLKIPDWHKKYCELMKIKNELHIT